MTGRAGSGKTHYVLELLARFLRDRPGHEALVILPTKSQVEHLKDLFLSSGRAPALREDTFCDFDALSRAGRPDRPASYPQKVLILNRILEGPAGGQFESVAATPGFHLRCLAIIKEIKENLLSPRAFSGLCERLGRGRDLAPLYQAYQESLEQLGLKDEEDLVIELKEKTKSDKALFGNVGLLILDGFQDYTPAQWAVLEALAERIATAVVTLCVDRRRGREELFASPLPTLDRLIEMGFTVKGLDSHPRFKASALADLEAKIFADTGPGIGDDGSIVVTQAADILDEVETIARQVLRLVKEGQWSYSDIGIVCRDTARYGPLIAGVFEARGIPVRLFTPRPLAHNSLVRDVMVLLEALTAALDLPSFLTIIRSDYLLGVRREVADWVEHRALGRAVRIDWHSVQNEGMAKEFPAIGGELDRLAGAKESFAGSGEPQQISRLVIETIYSFLGAWARDEGPELWPLIREEAEGLKALVATVEEVADLYRRRGVGHISVGELVRDLNVACRTATYWRRDLRRDAVSVVDALEARQWELPVIFVCGLVEGEFPPPAQADIFLDGVSRRAMNRWGGLSFREEGDEGARQRYLFYVAVTRAREQLFLSWPLADARGDETLPSFYLMEMSALFGEENWLAAVNWRDMGSIVPLPEEAADPCELMSSVAAHLSDGAATADEGQLLWLYNHCLTSDLFREHFRAGAIKGIPARLSPETVQALPRALPHYSVTQLDDFWQCPYRHFSRYLLGLQEPPWPIEERVGSKLMGLVAHQVLAAVFSPGEDRDLAEICATAFRDRAGSAPLGPDQVVARAEMASALERFVKEERDRLAALPLIPWEREAPFGGPEERPPLIIEVPGVGPVPFRGKLDRLDLGTQGNRQVGLVVDYKLSRHLQRPKAPDKWVEKYGLQIPLYLLALSHVWNILPGGGTICALKSGGRIGVFNGELWPGEEGLILGDEQFKAFLEECRDQAAALVREILSGEVRTDPRDKNRCGPTGCPFSAVCRYEKWQRS